MKIAVVGAGFLGCTLSLVLSNKNKVDLYEKTSGILSGASSYNQMRFHSGYHYPRSQKTFNEIKKSKKHFLNFFSKKIFGNTQNFYSIPYQKTKTTPKKYEKFLKKNNISLLVHGNDNPNLIDKKKLVIFNRTKGISSTILRKRSKKILEKIDK